MDDQLGHGHDHSGVIGHTHHHACAEHGGNQGDDLGGMGGQAGLLVLWIGVIHGQRQHAAHHENGVVGQGCLKQQHEHDNGQDYIIPEQLGALQGQNFRVSRGLCCFSGRQNRRFTGAPPHFDAAHYHGQAYAAEPSENLHGQIGAPQQAGIHGQGDRLAVQHAAPWHQVHYRDNGTADRHDGGNADVQLFAQRQQGGNRDQVGGGAVAVQVAQGGDEDHHQKNSQYMPVGDSDQFLDQLVKHAHVGHDAEVGHNKHEQGRHTPGSADAVLDKAGDIRQSVAVDHGPQNGQHHEQGHGDGLPL